MAYSGRAPKNEDQTQDIRDGDASKMTECSARIDLLRQGLGPGLEDTEA